MKRLLLLMLRPTSRRRTIALAAIGFGAGLAIMVSLGGIRHSVAAEAAIVEIDNYKFAPDTLTIPTGGSVTWVNKDEDVHSIAADDSPASFKSAGLDTDDKFTFVFTKPGTYAYHCSLHPHMTGKIIVQ